MRIDVVNQPAAYAARPLRSAASDLFLVSLVACTPRTPSSDQSPSCAATRGGAKGLYFWAHPQYYIGRPLFAHRNISFGARAACVSTWLGEAATHRGGLEWAATSGNRAQRCSLGRRQLGAGVHVLPTRRQRETIIYMTMNPGHRLNGHKRGRQRRLKPCPDQGPSRAPRAALQPRAQRA